MSQTLPRALVAAIALLVLRLAALNAAVPEPIVYTIRMPAPETQIAEIDATFPTEGQAAIELMMPVWSPGFYRVQDYAARVESFAARTPAGAGLTVEKPAANRWRIATGGASSVRVTYRLLCQSRSVTTNWVGADYAVFNGPATFITLADGKRRVHEVRLELPAAWTQSATSLDERPDGRPHQYTAPDFDVLADSPIVAGRLSVHRFDVAGTPHDLVNFGDVGQWDAAAAVRGLQKIADEHRRFVGTLPFRKYVFLNAFRQAGGGLEHLNSTLLTSSARNPVPTVSWLKFVSHEYFHAFNVKRLRPIELGPFDYEKPPRTTGLWLAEGVTTYFGDLAVVRAGVSTQAEYLTGLSDAIRSLQTSPGRLKQTLEQSSLDVWNNSTSGVGVNRGETVSYYTKGHVVGFVLDGYVRRATGDTRSFDDVWRLAYKRYGGERGFKAEELVATVEEVARVKMTEWFRKTLASTEELDYTGALDWFGLRFATTDPPDPAKEWTIEVRPDATDAQKQRLTRYLAPSK
jgi:predicted metalloprotease with PDZ domain